MDAIILGLMAFITFGISFYTFIKLFSVYRKYRQVGNASNLSGVEVAEKILAKNKLDNVYIVEIKGELTDNYDNTRKVVRLSKPIFHGDSLMALVVAAETAATAIKNKNKSFLLKLRNLLLTTVNILTLISYVGLIIAIISGSFRYIELAISVMFIIFLFHVLTLKAEKDISIRACLELKRHQLITKEEIDDVKIISDTLAYRYLSSLFLIIYQLFGYLLKNR